MIIRFSYAAMILLLISCSAIAPPSTGSFFGYHLGDKFDLATDHTQGDYGAIVESRNNNLNVQHVELALTSKTHVIGSIRGLAEFESWVDARAYASTVSKRLSDKYGGWSLAIDEIVPAMNRQAIVTDKGERFLPLEVYQTMFASTYDLKVILFPPIIGRKPFVMIEFGFSEDSHLHIDWMELSVKEEGKGAEYHRIPQEVIDEFEKKMIGDFERQGVE